jgi:hypothetical protein
MSDDLDALLRDHYRRAAEGVQPDHELIDRLRNAARPARAVPGWPRMLLAAAAVAAIALVAWGLLRPDHPAAPSRRTVPIAPPPTTTAPTPPPHSSTPTEHPSPRPTKPLRPTVDVTARPTAIPTRKVPEAPRPSSTRHPTSVVPQPKKR